MTMYTTCILCIYIRLVLNTSVLYWHVSSDVVEVTCPLRGSAVKCVLSSCGLVAALLFFQSLQLSARYVSMIKVSYRHTIWGCYPLVVGVVLSGGVPRSHVTPNTDWWVWSTNRELACIASTWTPGREDYLRPLNYMISVCTIASSRVSKTLQSPLDSSDGVRTWLLGVY